MTNKKYKFVEEFINPETNAPYENPGSPAVKRTKYFGDRTLHQIARIAYLIVDGVQVEQMGAKGGWIEKKSNLSQAGLCWVATNGLVVGESFVSGNAQIVNGEVGDAAKVDGDVQIDGQIGVGGNAYVNGHASVKGSPRLAVSGHAIVSGTVDGNATVSGSSYVAEDAVVKGNARVDGHAQVYGTVGGSAIVAGEAVVYGNVGESAKVMGTAIIFKTGKVTGSAAISAGVIAGTVSGKTIVENGQPHISAAGEVKDQATIAGNVGIGGIVAERGKVVGNANVAPNGTVAGSSSAEGNGVVGGQCRDGNISRGAAVLKGGALMNGSLTDGCRINSGGRLVGGAASGNVSIGRRVTGRVDGTMVVTNSSIVSP